MSTVNPNDQAGDPVALGQVAPPSYFPPADESGTHKEIPVNSEQANEDHHGRIAELAVQLRNASPSGANTISDKILYHLNAIQNPEEHEAAEAKLKETEDEAEAQRAKERAERKKPVEPRTGNV